MLLYGFIFDPIGDDNFIVATCHNAFATQGAADLGHGPIIGFADCEFEGRVYGIVRVFAGYLISVELDFQWAWSRNCDPKPFNRVGD